LLPHEMLESCALIDHFEQSPFLCAFYQFSTLFIMTFLVSSFIPSKETCHSLTWTSCLDSGFWNSMVRAAKHSDGLMNIVSIPFGDALAQFADVSCFHTSVLIYLLFFLLFLVECHNLVVIALIHSSGTDVTHGIADGCR